MSHLIDQLEAARAALAELDAQLLVDGQPVHAMVTCGECGGTGVDPGSLYQPEECDACGGHGTVLAPEEVERIARRPPGRALPDAPNADYWAEREWRYGS